MERKPRQPKHWLSMSGRFLLLFVFLPALLLGDSTPFSRPSLRLLLAGAPRSSEEADDVVGEEISEPQIRKASLATQDGRRTSYPVSALVPSRPQPPLVPSVRPPLRTPSVLHSLVSPLRC